MLRRRLTIADLDGVTKYVLGERGSDGGYLSFQYMDMFESSAEDTFYALSILAALKVEPPRVGETINFLRCLQDCNGSYRSIEVAYYSITALNLLNARPRDPKGAADFLRKTLKLVVEQLDDGAWTAYGEPQPLIDEKGILKSKDATFILTPADETPRLNRISMIVVALNTLGEIQGNSLDMVADTLLRYWHSDGGFGCPVPLLESTYWAIKGLSALGYSKLPTETVQWIFKCENENGGFNATPQSRNYFVENLYYGLHALGILGYSPRYVNSHLRYISNLQNANGGFRRSPSHGASSLEYTYYAIHSMKILGAL